MLHRVSAPKDAGDLSSVLVHRLNRRSRGPSRTAVSDDQRNPPTELDRPTTYPLTPPQIRVDQ